MNLTMDTTNTIIGYRVLLDEGPAKWHVLGVRIRGKEVKYAQSERTGLPAKRLGPK